MANKITGLTVEIGGDTTKLGKALEEVNKKSRDLSSELGEVNRLLKMDPGNADLLAQKQKILAEAIEATSKKLETLQEAERQVQAQFERGEVSEEQVRALKREVEAAALKLGAYKQAAKETADEVENLGKESKASAEDLSKIASGGLATVGGLVTAAAGALVGAAEATRDYRAEMVKLDTAFTDNGHTSEAAVSAYQELQGILGETDQAVEAANHLALLTDNEKDLATWTGDILPGIFATFGASLPLEGLTEAANHTAKLGEVQGPLADALEWAGLSTDEFNEKLAKCSNEQERQTLIMQTLNGVYGRASAVYKETNADVIAANQANEAWTASLAQVGGAIEPMLTKIKEVGAELLGKLVPVIEKLLDNLPIVAVALGGITAALVSYKVAALAATAAEKGMTLAQYGAAIAQKVLNAALLANPIGIVIVAITALVAAFMYLWKNCEGFREFWINLWNKVKSIAMSVLVELPKKVISVGKDLVTGLWKGVKDKLAWLKKKLSSFTTSVLDSIKGFFGVKSPSRKTAWIGEMLDAGLAQGVEDNASDPITAMQRVTGGVLDAASGVNGLSLTRSLSSPRGASAGAVAGMGDNSTLGAKLDLIAERLNHLQVVTETGALVGEIIDKVDGALATRQALHARGV